MSGWTRYWLVWAVAVIASFFAVELPAVLNDQHGDTLTENVVTHVPGEPLVAVFGGLVVWLAVHFGTRYAKKRRTNQEK